MIIGVIWVCGILFLGLSHSCSKLWVLLGHGAPTRVSPTLRVTMAVADQKREESKGLQCCIARGVGAVEDAKERDHFRRVLKCCPKAQCPAWSEAALKDFNLDRAEWDFDEQPGVKVKQRTKKPRESLEDYSESMLVPHRCNTGGSHAPSLPQTRQPARHIALQSMTLCRSCDHILRFRLCLCIHVVQGTGEVSSAVRASGSRKNLVHSVSHWCGGLRSLPCVWLQLVSLPLCSCPGIPSSRQSGCLVDQYSRDVKSSSSILSVCLWMVGIFCQKEACCWMGEHGWKLEGLCKLCSACAVANGSFPRVLFAL